MSARLHPQIQAYIDLQVTPPDQPGPPDLEALREAHTRRGIELGGVREEVDATDDVVIPRADGGRVPARVYTPLHGARVAGRLLWLHGGGWSMGSLEGFDRVCRSLANAGGMEVVSVDYRLAPEHPCPAAIDDADAAVAWAVQRGDGVVVGGDSSGGNLAAVAARHARDAGLRLRGQALVYPATDATMAGASYREHADNPMLTAAEMAACWEAYRAGRAVDDPDVSPLLAGDLSYLPPTFVAVAGHDPLRDDGLAYAAALRAAGVEVELQEYADMTHSFLRMSGSVDRARELIKTLGAFAAARLA